jgi:hypothetical protein
MLFNHRAFKAKTTVGGQVSVGEILERFWVRSNNSFEPIWSRVDGTILTTDPVIGTDFDPEEVFERNTSVLKSTGTITTQNVNAFSGTPVAGSVVQINPSITYPSICAYITGTYTANPNGFGLIPQATYDGVNWFNVNDMLRIISSTDQTNFNNGIFLKPWTRISSILSGRNGSFLFPNYDYKFFRICCINGAVTGTANVELSQCVQQFPLNPELDKYHVVRSALAPGAVATTDLFTMGFVTNVQRHIKITSFQLSGGSTAVQGQNLQLVKRTAQNTGGTTSTLINQSPAVIVSLDNSSPRTTLQDSSGICQVYTAQPTSVGAGSVILARRIALPTLTTQNPFQLDFNGELCNLKAANEFLALNFNGGTLGAGTTLSFQAGWIEI